MRMIPFEKCEDGWLYHIDARNASIGIFRENEKGFNIARYKIGPPYLFMEYHWDTGAPHGTVKPIKKLCKAGQFSSEKAEVDWLVAMWKKYGKEIEESEEDISER